MLPLHALEACLAQGHLICSKEISVLVTVTFKNNLRKNYDVVKLKAQFN
jgi:hypothetical protein